MVYCLFVKMTNQIISYFFNKEDHLDQNNKSKLTCLDWQDIFYECYLGYVLIFKNSIKKL
jgi:hypothetical protein